VQSRARSLHRLHPRCFGKNDFYFARARISPIAAGTYGNFLEGLKAIDSLPCHRLIGVFDARENMTLGALVFKYWRNLPVAVARTRKIQSSRSRAEEACVLLGCFRFQCSLRDIGDYASVTLSPCVTTKYSPAGELPQIPGSCCCMEK
jgi:hypothetical protein